MNQKVAFRQTEGAETWEMVSSNAVTRERVVLTGLTELQAADLNSIIGRMYAQGHQDAKREIRIALGL